MFKKIAIIALSVFILAMVGRSFVLPMLTPKLIDHALEKNFSKNLIEELPDGLHVALCGAGSPLYDPERSGPCTAVIAGKKLFIFDAGDSAAKNLVPMAIDAGRLEAVFLTHFHSDHIDGLGALALMRWVTGNHTMPLPVYGPPGLEEIVDGFNQAYRLDADYRTAHHGEGIAPPGGAGMQPQVFSMPVSGTLQGVYDDGELTIFAFRVEHDPVSPALGYRIHYKDRSLVISGDTKKSELVAKAAKDADLLLHEVLDPKMVGKMIKAANKAGLSGREKILQDILDYHTSPVEAAQIAQQAGVKHLMFTHVVPATPGRQIKSYYLKGVTGEFSGNITLGVDFDLIMMPADSKDIAYRHLN